MVSILQIAYVGGEKMVGKRSAGYRSEPRATGQPMRNVGRDEETRTMQILISMSVEEEMMERKGEGWVISLDGAPVI